VLVGYCVSGLLYKCLLCYSQIVVFAGCCITGLLAGNDSYCRVISRAQLEAPDTLGEQRKLMASICAELAEYHAEERDYERAIRLYKEAATHDDADGVYGLQLAHLLLLTEVKVTERPWLPGAVTAIMRVT